MMGGSGEGPLHLKSFRATKDPNPRQKYDRGGDQN